MTNISSFLPLGISSALTRALNELGYSEPTPVQQAAIPAALEGRDLCVCAQTGSGKTAAFLLPALTQLQQNKSHLPGRGPRVLVLAPTRELVQQIEGNAKDYARHMKWLRSVSLVGGTPYGLQNRMLSRPIDLVIATPGRLMDHMRQGRVDFQRVEILVLDEADRMLDMGFIDDIKAIAAAIDHVHQTLLFSATLDGQIGRLAADITNEPVRIDIARQDKSGQIDEKIFYCNDIRHKEKLLQYWLRDTSIEQAVIFTATKVMSEALAERLSAEGYAACALHGDMPQPKRNRIMKMLQNRRLRLLVATDVAARGLDVEGISHVFNFDMPRQAEDYVHRIGRTGRAGRRGMAISFVDRREQTRVHAIERYIKRTLAVEEIAGMEPTFRHKKARPDHSKHPNRNKTEYHKKSTGAKKTYGGKKAVSHTARKRQPDAARRPKRHHD